MVKKVEEKKSVKKVTTKEEGVVKVAVKKEPVVKQPQDVLTDSIVSVQKKAIAKKEEGSSKNTNKVSSRVYKSEDTVYSTGRRKAASARVFCKNVSDDKISITVNDRPLKQYFVDDIYSGEVLLPFNFLGLDSGFEINITVAGGGLTGQSGAARLGISKCLSLLSDSNKIALRKAGFLTRDSRVVESKKAGFRKARKKEQFSKR